MKEGEIENLSGQIYLFINFFKWFSFFMFTGTFIKTTKPEFYGLNKITRRNTRSDIQ